MSSKSDIFPRERIRNFSIIAHIDHGKSTLADRILEITGAVTAREAREQYLDSMDLERERGITIKAQAVRLQYKAKDGKVYIFHLIDTPGHVDFNYEVSRSLSACEGAILVVDASQGVEAQTLANVYLALDNDLEIVPILNKIDLPSARPAEIREEIEEIIGLDGDMAVECSAKTGFGVADVLEAVIKYIPPPKGDPEAPLQALIFDSWFDAYRGVITLIRVMEGTIRKGDKILLMATHHETTVEDLGVSKPQPTIVDALYPGDVGFIITGIKEVRHSKVGDTITHKHAPAAAALEGFQEVKPMVYAGLFPMDTSGYEGLRDALEKLQLNDAALTYEPETSLALGFGFRCGFLGLLHMEIIQERLEREYNLELITTAPTVVYQVITTKGQQLWIENPSKLPEVQEIEEFLEPYVEATIHVPSEYIGAVLKLCEERRGEQKQMQYTNRSRVMITYHMPFGEVVFDFFDRLKSNTKGYATLDYKPIGYRTGQLSKLDMLVNGEKVDALSIIVHRDSAYARGKALAAKLREIIPRQQYEVAIQAAIGAKIVARETVKAFRKNVTAKCYGGDISRKRKLIERQKEGKKRMKQVGSVEIPQDAFLAVLRMDED
jgi:GTP-binding protein LepA